MKLYLDDDHASQELAGKLRNAGHDVQLPVEVGLRGTHDAIHLLHAIQEGRVTLTGNQRDFEALHALVTGLAFHHPGIMIVCREKNPSRNMKTRDIVRAVGNLGTAHPDLTGQVQVLNQWR